MILEVQGLCKSFGGVRAVDRVSFGVEEGEISAIIGPNGAGKTTLFNLLTGHLRPDAGRVIFKGEDITQIPSYTISQKRVGRAFQRTNIFSRLSVFDNVQIGVITSQRKNSDLFSRAKKMAVQETEEILEEVGLSNQRNVIASTLSHGDQKKLDIAVALACQPELLLLDEPSAGMSPDETRAVADLIQRLAKGKGIPLVFIEHDMFVVFGISEKIRVMHQGRIIAEGTPEEVSKNEEVQRVYLG